MGEKEKKNEINNYLFDRIFNDEMYRIFPQLYEFYCENLSLMMSLFSNFLMDIYDLSKPVVIPFNDEIVTYTYRKACGILDDGEIPLKKSIAEELHVVVVTIVRWLREADFAVCNMLIGKYNKSVNKIEYEDLCIEELGLPKPAYNALKRLGINNVSEIDFSILRNSRGVGEKTYSIIEDSVIRARK